RLDSGVGAGNEIGTFYDAMIAKVIVWGATRDEAMRRLAGALQRARIHGLRTNRDFLVNLLRDPVLLGATMHTTYLDSVDLAPLTASGYDEAGLALAARAAVLADREAIHRGAKVQSRIPTGWRNVFSAHPVTKLLYGDEVLDVTGQGEAKVIAVSADEVVLDDNGVRHTFRITRTGPRIDVDSALGHVAFVKQPRFTDPADQVATGSLLAPMPGSVVAVLASPGDEVSAGQTVLVLEAMKMQHNVSAPYDGVVAELDVKVGQQVSAGDVLAVVSTNEEQE
ncbi:MAG TPA: biotin/lipoyl-containing protein, partial [Nocardioidaceae bacterium]|nr:biotin/lipoyl-containing protein [Nocardioidaceae bacterium]